MVYDVRHLIFAVTYPPDRPDSKSDENYLTHIGLMSIIGLGKSFSWMLEDFPGRGCPAEVDTRKAVLGDQSEEDPNRQLNWVICLGT